MVKRRSRRCNKSEWKGRGDVQLRAKEVRCIESVAVISSQDVSCCEGLYLVPKVPEDQIQVSRYISNVTVMTDSSP